ncbi:MAG: thioredoxin family protein [Ignavibacteriae bacterium HGW-Ignavibacteriae-4]|nr:MAG: thioredoxin family protein [Ignavibacteriae bacterium HGW-Ignavibacteriae-4]
MKNLLNKSISLIILLPICMLFFSFKPIPTNSISDFSLKNVDGKMVSTTDYMDAKGFIIIFTCNHCPFAKLYSERLNDLNTKYSKLNVPVFAINSMDELLYKEESFEMMQQKAKKDKFNYPYLHDADQKIGQLFGTEHPPTAYVIWKQDAEWVVKYTGSIDDNGEQPDIANPFVANAVDDLLEGKQVSNPFTESFGCRIFYRAPKE